MPGFAFVTHYNYIFLHRVTIMVEKVVKSMKRYKQMEEGSLLTSPRENLSESFQSGKRKN